MSLDGDLLFPQSDYPQSDYFPELNNDNTAFDEADFEKDLFGPATSGLSEHSGVQAPQANYDGLVSDPLNIDDDHFLRSLQQHEELEVDSKASHSGTSSHQGGGGTKQEMHPLYANGQVNMVPVSSGPMFHYSQPTTGGFVQQGMPPPGSGDFGTAATMERLDRLALENQHMQQYQQQQELLQAQQRQLQAQQQQLQSLQQAQLQHVLYTQTPQQPVMFLGPRPGAPYLPSPRGIPHTGPPQVVYALPHPGGLPVQLQPLPPGVTYHSTVAPIPIDQALTGKYFAPLGPGVPPVQMNPPPLLMPASVQMNSTPVHTSPRPLHISAPVSPRVSAPQTPRSPRQQGGVKLEDGTNSPTVRQGGRAPSGGGEPNSGRASPSGDRKPPRSPTVPEQHPRPPLPTSHAVYMPVQYIQGGAPQFPRVQSADLLSQVDASGDVLRPLPPMPQRGGAGAQGLSALQRSQSSHSLGQLPMGPHMDAMGLQRLESPAPYQMPNQGLGGMPIRQPSAMASAGMRRVQSTGDIQSWNRGPSAQNGDGAGGAHYDDFKVGRYTVEERKMRIQRYRQKRNERNYNKKIKYVCRKTLADSRPRIRGRFAKNDEVPGFTEAKKALEEEEDDSDFDEDLIMEEGETLLLGGAEFDVLNAQRPLASSVSAPTTLSA